MFRRLTAVLAVAMLAMPALAQTNNAADRQDIIIDADRLEYDRSSGVMKANGNVTVKHGKDVLTCKELTARVDTSEVWAKGDAKMTRGATTWSGNELWCNFENGDVRTGESSEFYEKPYHIRAKSAKRYDDGKKIVGDDASITTCGEEHPHYHLRAKQIILRPGRDVYAERVTFYFAGIPFFYLPAWRQSMDGRGFEVRPGYSTRQGGYALMSYGYDISDHFWGRTHVDYRSKRGWGLGQDFYSMNTDGRWDAEFMAYYLDDKRPVDDDEDADADSLNEGRYRVKLAHRYRFQDEATYSLTRIHYLSDTDVLEDFFRSEYRQEPKPENYVVIKHRKPNYSIGLAARKQLNEFYEAVDRLPEVSFDLPMRKLWDTPVFYGGKTTLGYLDKVYPESSSSEPYDTFRLDSLNEFSMSRKVGFLNVVPGVNYRSSYYSTTRIEEEVLSEDGSNTTTVVSDGGGKWRSVLELGLKGSFKAFKMIRDPEEGVGGLRHVVEPYGAWTFRMDPTVGKDDLYQFDYVDDIEGIHRVKLGVRNKWQSRRRNRPHDLVDLDLWAALDLDPDSGDDLFESANMDVEFRIWNDIRIDLDAEYSIEDSTLAEANAHLILGKAREAHVDLEYRFKDEEKHLFLADLTTNPKRSWTGIYDVRYDVDESVIEEQTAWIKRNYDCMYAAVGVSHLPGYTRTDGTERDEEFKFLFRIWVTAFPGVGLSID